MARNGLVYLLLPDRAKHNWSLLATGLQSEQARQLSVKVQEFPQSHIRYPSLAFFGVRLIVSFCI